VQRRVNEQKYEYDRGGDTYSCGSIMQSGHSETVTNQSGFVVEIKASEIVRGGKSVPLTVLPNSADHVLDLNSDESMAFSGPFRLSFFAPVVAKLVRRGSVTCG
jgi:hypothetical protein